MDHFSRYIVLAALKTVDQFSVANAFFQRWVTQFGFPELIVFDSGSNFKSSFHMELSRLMGIKTHPFPAEAQYRNGKVERVHRYLGERLRIWLATGDRQWLGALPYIQIAHHSMRIKRLGKSPLELLIGVDAVIPFLNGPGGNVQGSYSRLAKAHVERHQQQLESIRHDMRELEMRLQHAVGQGQS